LSHLLFCIVSPVYCGHCQALAKMFAIFSDRIKPKRI
jgi:hypothetical protein